MTPRRFRTIVYRHYAHRGRHHLPWRETSDPYRILVSEVMLQQTQVDRVISFYERFLTRFQNVEALAQAPLGDVLRLWQGLGYNRRAKMLHQCARTVTKELGGVFPRTASELLLLSGVGPYTAHAVLAFAHDEPVVMIETNIRAAHIHHFFPERTDVHDRELLPLIENTLDHTKPRIWYAALMDYGAHLKRTVGNASRHSAHHTQQSTFKGSDRQIRGAIVKALTHKNFAEEKLIETIGFERLRIHEQLAALISEGLIERSRRGVYRLP